MSLRVLKSGFLTLLQDYGRYGYQHVGLTHSGPLDEHAYLWANYLLGNHYNAVQLEINYGVFSAEFLHDTVIALCGADLRATLNQKEVAPWQSYNINKGDVINFSAPLSGLRCYLAIQGGFNVKQTLSSVATVVREKLGGLVGDGVKLTEGDVIPFEPQPHKIATCVPAAFIPHYHQSITLRYIPNHSVTSTGIESQQQFQQKTYEVTQNIDRMGYRLYGDPINTPLSGIISQGLSMGAIQVPKDGQPIVLMRDRQTMGGYPLLGCVSSLDLPLLAQSTPGTQVSFEPVDLEFIEAELILHKQFFNIKV